MSKFIETHSVPTLAVTRESFNINVNRDFVVEVCESLEHLACVITHELLHIIFAQLIDTEKKTERDWELHNIAFDAVVNAYLYHFYEKDERYHGILLKINPPDSFPGNILRPNSDLKTMPEDVAKAYEELYEYGIGSSTIIYDLLKKHEDKIPHNHICILLGGHGDSSSADYEADNASKQIPGLADEIEKIINRLGDKFSDKIRKDIEKEMAERGESTNPEEAGNSSAGGIDAGYSTDIKDAIIKFREKILNQSRIEEIMTKMATPDATSQIVGHINKLIPDQITRTPVFNPYDKRSISCAINDIYRPFHRKKKLPDCSFDKCHVYIDVSGSVDAYLPIFREVVRTCREKIGRLFLFSNAVYETTIEKFGEKGESRSTGGTDDCWLAHAIENRLEKFVIFTDGYFSISSRNKQKLPKNYQIIASIPTGCSSKVFSEIKNNVVEIVFMEKAGDAKF